MSKPDLIQRILAALKADRKVMEEAAREAHESATGDETRSEGKYDTRAIEAAYLAGAQSEQAAKLAEAIRLFETLDPPDYADDEAIGPGALVEAEHDGEILFYLLGPAAGGVTVEHEGFECTVLTPDSRLYQELLGTRTGELLDESGVMVLGVT